MKLQLIRNATMKISLAGRTLLTDPMLARPGEIRSFAGIAPNPTVALPLSLTEILAGVDALLVSHDHPDHFDPAASQTVPKDTRIWCQPGMENRLRADGFSNVEPIGDTLHWSGITVHRTGGRHGQGAIEQAMGPVSGFVFQAEGEPTVYWVGDSIWCAEVETAIDRFRPEVIVTHSGGAKLPGHEVIVMDAQQTLALLRVATEAKVVAVHLEALDHCTVSRAALRELADQAGIPPTRLLIPADGETVAFG